MGVHGFARVRGDGDIEDAHVGIFEQDFMTEGSGGEGVHRVKGGGGLARETAAGVLELNADGVERSVAEIFCVMERLGWEKDDARFVVGGGAVHHRRLAFDNEASGREAVGDHDGRSEVGVNFLRRMRRGGDFEDADVIGFDEDIVVRGRGDDSVG